MGSAEKEGKKQPWSTHPPPLRKSGSAARTIFLAWSNLAAKEKVVENLSSCFSLIFNPIVRKIT